MQFSSAHAAASVLVVLGAATVIFRLRESESKITEPPESRLTHVGVSLPDGELGLVAAPADALSAAAMSALNLPEDCATSVDFRTVEDGTLLRFEERDGRCRSVGATPQKGALRLMSGLPLNVNEEDEEGLRLLPGIGPVKARALVESRRRDGPFADAAELMRVSGIGPKTAEKLSPWIDF